MRVGGIVLCGGRSRRMGMPKALLPFGPERMLDRVVRRLREVVEPIVVVAAPHQDFRWPDGVLVVRDRTEGRGPLEGLHAGLLALRERADAAYATACDVPLLVPALVRLEIDWLADYDVVVPVDGEFHHPLAAVYRTRVLPAVETLLAAGRLRPVFLYETVATLRVSVDQLRTVDPELHTLANLNLPCDYFTALASAGYEPPPALLQALTGASQEPGAR